MSNLATNLVLLVVSIYLIYVSYSKHLDQNRFKKILVILSYFPVFAIGVLIGGIFNVLMDEYFGRGAALYGFFACCAHFGLIKRYKK